MTTVWGQKSPYGISVQPNASHRASTPPWETGRPSLWRGSWRLQSQVTGSVRPRPPTPPLSRCFCSPGPPASSAFPFTVRGRSYPSLTGTRDAHQTDVFQGGVSEHQTGRVSEEPGTKVWLHQLSFNIQIQCQLCEAFNWFNFFWGGRGHWGDYLWMVSRL